MTKAKILYGVCGIGLGHTFRQLPIIDHYARTSRVVIFGFGESYKFYSQRFQGSKSVTVLPVCVPFYVGGQHGIDFAATAARPGNFTERLALNCESMAAAERLIGRPDLVVSDYEPNAALYAYAKAAQLVTIDQQSKYLVGGFPAALHRQCFDDEVARLRMFFPKADARIACSFFRVPPRPRAECRERVLLLPPILKDEILSLQLRRPDRKSILVYISSQREFPQPLDEVARACASHPEWDFHIFLPQAEAHRSSFGSHTNVALHKPGDSEFYAILARCRGIISTAGHSLLSEAMYLGIPVYAIPLPVYE